MTESSYAVEELLTTLLDETQERNIKRNAIYGLVKIGTPEAVQALIEGLASDIMSQDIEEIFWQSERIAKPSVIPLANALQKHPNPAVRSGSATALWHILVDHTDTVAPLIYEPLMSALNDDHYRVRKNATWTLELLLRRKKGDERVVEPLMKLLNDPFPVVRGYAAEALRFVPETRVVESLIHALKSDDLEFYRKLANSLAVFGDVRAVHPLQELLKIGETITMAVRAALLDIGVEPETTTQNPFLHKSSDSQWLQENEPRLLDPTQPLEKRKRLASMDGFRNHPESLRLLIDDVADENLQYEVRESYLAIMIWSQVEVVGLSTIDLVADFLLHHPNPKVRSWIPDLLRDVLVRKADKVGDRLIEPLLSALSDDYDPTREHVIEALGELLKRWKKDERIIVALISSLKDSSLEVRRVAAKVIRYSHDKRAVEPLIKLLDENDEVLQFHVVNSLALLNDERAIVALKPILNHTDEQIRKVTYSALRRLGVKIDDLEAE